MDYWSLWGNPELRDPSLNALSEWEIKKMIVRGEADIQDVGNAHGIFRIRNTGRWTMLTGGWKNDRWPTVDEAFGRPDSTYTRHYDTWDADEFKKRWAKMYDKHQMLKEVYATTIQAVKTSKYISQTGRPVSIPPDPILSSGTCFYDRELVFDAPEEVFNTKIEVTQEDSLVAAKRLLDDSETNVAVLNMANRQTPGGGVYNGAGAQEESCFRRSNYYLSLYQFADFASQYGVARRPERYPLDRNYGGCFSPNITVFRGSEDDGYPFLDTPWKVNFIAVAALNRPATFADKQGKMRIIDELVPVALNKIRTVLNIAIDNGIETLVLGALGCGAFKNPPEHVAELFAQVLEEPVYKGRFRRIVFAILSRYGNTDNYRAFSAQFGYKNG